MPVRQSLRRLATFLLLALFGESRLMRACLCLCSLVLASQVWATPCDVDGDGDIDLDDLTLIQQAILARTPVSGPGDPRDADSNGVINSIDGRLCALRCTRPKCATTNSPPLANAGPDQSVPFGKLVSLDGSSSRDPEGATLTYNWSLIGRPAGSNAVLAAANSKNPTFTADRPGDYLAQLIVSDGQLSSVPDTVSITVTHNPPTVSLTAPAAGAVYTLPATVTLTATASGAEANTPISRVDFYQGTTLIGGGTASPYTIIWTPTIAGSYSLTAKATDSAGGVTTSAARSITVQAANQLPSVSLSSPVADQSFTAPANVTLTATASDADGTLAMVEFFQGATLIGSATTAPYSVVWSDVPVGSYSLTAKATDNLGGTRTSAEVPITVTPAGPTILYLHGDHLGTPRVATNESNVVVWRNLPTTEPFGMALPEEDPDGDGKATVINLRFPGQYFDRETQLHYNYFRDCYDPATGRYCQSDPIGLAGGINAYSYVNGNPLSYADPSSLHPLIGLILRLLGMGLTAVGAADMPEAGLGGGASMTAKAVGKAAAQCTGRGAIAATDEAFHYTFGRSVSSIERQGLRAGSYATPNGALSPLQAQIDLALPPNRGLPESLLRVDLAGMRQAGYQIPDATQVGRSFAMPGGGFEMQFPYPIPPQFIKVIRP